MKTAKAICKKNAAIMATERSFPIKDRRFRETKLAEAAPVRIIMIHRRISTGISNRKEDKMKMVSEYPHKHQNRIRLAFEPIY